MQKQLRCRGAFNVAHLHGQWRPSHARHCQLRMQRSWYAQQSRASYNANPRSKELLLHSLSSVRITIVYTGHIFAIHLPY